MYIYILYNHTCFFCLIQYIVYNYIHTKLLKGFLYRPVVRDSMDQKDSFGDFHFRTFMTLIIVLVQPQETSCTCRSSLK